MTVCEPDVLGAALRWRIHELRIWHRHHRHLAEPAARTSGPQRQSVLPLGEDSASTTWRPRFLASSSVPSAIVLCNSVSSWMTATVFSPRRAAMSISPSRNLSAGEVTPKTNFRPFL